MKNLSLFCWMAALLLSSGCVAYKKLPPQEILQSAQTDLLLWRIKGEQSPAEGAAEDRAEEALEKILFLQKKHPGLLDQETLAFLKAEALFANGKLGAAFSSFKEFRENYPLTKRKKELEFYIFQIGVLWSQSDDSFWGTGFFADKDYALEVFEYIFINMPLNKELVPNALRLAGDIYFERGDYDDAIAAYERILENYPGSLWADKAQFRIALSYFLRAKRPTADRDALVRAESRFTNYLKKKEPNFGTQARKYHTEVEEKLAESEFKIGEFYERIDEEHGARFYFEEVAQKYPQTEFGKLAAKKLQNENSP